MEKVMFRTDIEIDASIKHLTQIKQAMKDGKLAKSQDDMKGDLPKMMFSERTADELLQAMLTVKHFKSQLEETRITLETISTGFYTGKRCAMFADSTLVSLNEKKFKP